ncbi:MAG: DUF1573 domain-containing protein [Desulfobacteraceae bacterium]|nr:DUF1573 domain-containing protein [Desulfobacteraceae bacterium]
MHMKRISMLVMACAFACCLGAALPDEIPAAAPVVPERVYDFGEVIETVPVEHDFIIKNPGTETLHITEARPS